jgi:outer membrane lipoprotein SlyB
MAGAFSSERVDNPTKETETLRTQLIAAATLALTAATVAATPVLAQPHRHKVLVCTHSNHTTGTVVGAVAGGLLGNTLAHGGGKTGGTLIGAGAGAVAGHEIAKHNDHKHCHYEWRD